MATMEPMGNTSDRFTDTLPDLIATLNDSKVDVRRSAAAALGSIGLEAEAAVRALIETLKDSVANVRGWTATALRDNGIKAKAVVPALEALAGDFDPLDHVRWSENQALKAIIG
jgi:HEAT repeat protein